ncbi:hypothetical protein EIN_043080, partial [Entamoeba invadens IP1]
MTKQLQMVFLMNVTLYLKTADTLFNFILINKKCQLTVNSLHVNPAFNELYDLQWFLKNFTVDTVDLNYLDVPLQLLALPKRIRRYQSSQQSTPKSIISKLESIGSDEFAELYKTSVTSSVEEGVHNLCEYMEHVVSVRCVYFYMKCFTENFILQKVDKKYYPKFFYLIDSQPLEEKDFIYLENIAKKFDCKFVVMFDRDFEIFRTFKNVFFFGEKISLEKVEFLIPSFFSVTIIVDNTYNAKLKDLEKIEEFVKNYCVYKLTITTYRSDNGDNNKNVTKLGELESVEILNIENSKVVLSNKLKAKNVLLYNTKCISENAIVSVDYLSMENSECITVNNCNKFGINENEENDKNKFECVLYKNNLSFPFVNITELFLSDVRHFTLPVLTKLEKLTIIHCADSIFNITEKTISNMCLRDLENNLFVFYNETGREMCLHDLSNNSVKIKNKNSIPLSLVFRYCNNIKVFCEVIKIVFLYNSDNIVFVDAQNIGEFVTTKSSSVFLDQTQIENFVVAKTFDFKSFTYTNKVKTFTFLNIHDYKLRETLNCETVQILYKFIVAEECLEIDFSKQIMTKVLSSDNVNIKNARDCQLYFCYGVLKTLKIENLKCCTFEPVDLSLSHLEINNCSFQKTPKSNHNRHSSNFGVIKVNTIVIQNSENISLKLTEDVVQKVGIVNSDVLFQIKYSKDDYVKASQIYVREMQLKNSTCLCLNFQIGKVVLDFSAYKIGDEKCICLPSKVFHVENLKNEKVEFRRIEKVDKLIFSNCSNCEFVFPLISSFQIESATCDHVKIFIPQNCNTFSDQNNTSNGVTITHSDFPPVFDQIFQYTKSRRIFNKHYERIPRIIKEIKQFIIKPHLYDELEASFYIEIYQKYIVNNFGDNLIKK